MKNLIFFVLFIGAFTLALINTYISFMSDDVKTSETVSDQLVENKINSNKEKEEPIQMPQLIHIKGEGLKLTQNIQNSIQTSGTVTVPVNPPTTYNYKTKAEIYRERISYVKKVFNLPNYQPREQVFGSIVDNKPWIGLNAASCDWTMQDRSSGPSEESVFMNNPLALVGVEMPYYTYANAKSCTTSAYLVPNKITVSKDDVITIYYNISGTQKYIKPDALKYAIYYLKPINARDLGFEWGYVTSKSGCGFSNNRAIDDHPYNFLDYIHLGGACGMEGGCNNGSPNQTQLQFGIDSFPAKMDISLWRNEPSDGNVEPDVKVKIIMY